MKITYIGHSGFLAELPEAVLLFDYYQGTIPAFPEEKPLFVFVSHKHADHFRHSIFRLAEGRKDVTFLLSKDCRMSENFRIRKGIPREAWEQIRYLGAGEIWDSHDDVFLKAETLKSTDEGVAWMVTVGGTALYHAGDLNWWTWPGEETEEEYRDMTARFQMEMAKLSGRHFDAAFVPLDPRQGERYDWVLNAFLEKADASYVFPMHCWEDYGVIGRYLDTPEGEKNRERIVRIERPGQEFDIREKESET